MHAVGNSSVRVAGDSISLREDIVWNELALQTTHGDSYTDLIRLFKIREVLGPVFGSEDLCILLYSLIRREVPRTLVELGTGLGVSALWMAQAVKENGVGHVYTLDDGRDFDQSLDCLAKVDELLTPELHPMTKGGIEEHLARFSTACGLTEHLTFRRATFGDDGDDLLAPESCYFGDGTIDLLLADFAHDPESIMNILAFFLPRMSDCSSIFIGL